MLVASFIWSTRESAEAIKGGSTALRALLDQLSFHRAAVLSLLREEAVTTDRLARATVRSLVFQSLMASDVVQDLLAREVRSEKDFEWRVKPRCFLSAGNDEQVRKINQ